MDGSQRAHASEMLRAAGCGPKLTMLWFLFSVLPFLLPVTTSSRLRSIDALRGFAALAVVMHHSMQHAVLATANPVVLGAAAVLRLGYLGVPLFFVISGFCIHMAAASGRPLRPLDFWKRRLRRLYPPYLASLLFSMAIVAVAMAWHVHVAVASYPEPRWRF